MSVALVCQNCGQTFSAKPSQTSKKYCERSCYDAAQRKLHLTEAELLDLYVVQEMSLADIADKYDVSLQTVCNHMEENGILRRGLSEAHKAMYAGPRGEKRIQDRLDTLEKNHGTRNPAGSYGNLQGGWREDLQLKVRSGWEGNVLRWLTHQGTEWQYEPRRFYFPIKRGAVSYLPDIYLPTEDVFIEVKGRLTDKDRTRLKRFKKFFPDEFSKLKGITGSANQPATSFFLEIDIPILAYYNDLNKEFKDIVAHWGE